MTIIPAHILDEISSYSEAEVRFHIIDPILRHLGYGQKPDLYLTPEEKLTYPYYHIGHRSAKKDLPLGIADYRAGVKGARGSFVVEAKSPAAGITERDVEQAHSYAAHAQVGANFFVLCDGVTFSIYETLSGPNPSPIVSILATDLEMRIHELENILKPENLTKHCHTSYDLNLKLCDGLGSSVRIQSGLYTMAEWDVCIYVGGVDQTDQFKSSVPEMADIHRQLDMLANEFEQRVADGLAARDAEGRITAEVNFRGVTKNNQAGMELLGIDAMSFTTKDKFLSTDPNSPTVFETTADFSAERGTMMPPMFGEALQMGVDLNGDLFVTARMFKDQQVIKGEYAAYSTYRIDQNLMGDFEMTLNFRGDFSLDLDV